MIHKKRNKRSLAELATRFIDLGVNSSDFFNITYLPTQFTAGKNLFKFNPIVSRFSNADPILIEVIDFNGNQIYHEVLNYREEDGSLVVAIYVYEDTPPGECIITLVGTTKVDENLVPLPANEISPNNLKYTHKLYVNTSKENSSEIIYINKPIVNVQERKFSIVEEKFSGSKIGILYGTASYIVSSKYPTLISTNEPFRKDYENGIITLSSLSSNHKPQAQFVTSSFSFTSSILDVRTPFLLHLKDKVQVTGVNSETQYLTEITNQKYQVAFAYTPIQRLVTQNVKSYAQIDISKLQPDTGDTNRVKVFSKSTFKPDSEYELIYDAEIYPKNILVDVSSSLVEFPIGVFGGQQLFLEPTINPYSSSILDAKTYWIPTTTAPFVTASISSSDYPLFGSLIANTSIPISGSNDIIISQTGSISIPFYKDSEYHVLFDYATRTVVSESRDPKIYVYITGSSFVNDSIYGKFVGNVPFGSRDKRFDLDYTMKLPVNSDGNGRLVFVVRTNSIISNIRIQESVEFGFTPNRTRLYVPIKTDHRSEYLDFKLQFFGYSLNQSNEYVEVYDTYFRGGNNYVYGDDNITTGSVYLSPFTQSGIQLYANISASTSSGSAIKSYGYGGTNNAINNPTTSSNFGWGLTNHDPFHNNSDVGKSVQMINECGSMVEFKSTPGSFKLYLVGSESEMVVGCSGSSGQIGGGGPAAGCCDAGCGDSYIKWDGCRIVIKGAVDENGNPIGGTSGAGTPGADGSSGSSGVSGSSGSSGASGASGTSGQDGSSGSSGVSGSGTSGSSGQTGSSGTSGQTGSSGTSGQSGSSGTSGQDGSSGTSGQNGSSGTSGQNGSSGTSGQNGSSGTSGAPGTNGPPGTSGSSGLSASCCDCVPMMSEVVDWVGAGRPLLVTSGSLPLLHDCGVVSWTA